MSFRIPIEYLLTLTLGAGGAFVASLLDMPAPYLVGPAAVVTVASVAGLKAAIPSRLRDLAFLAVGLSMGSGVTPDVLAATRQWPLSFVALLFMTVLLLALGWVLLRKVFRYDDLTAMLAACPGHLSYVLSLAAGTKSDLASVSIIQSVRVLALTLLVPLIVEIQGLSPPGNLALPKSVGPVAVLLMALPAYGLGQVLQRVRVPAALLVGGMIISSAAHLTGMVEGVIPFWLQMPVYVVLGCMIGTRFAGVSAGDLKRSFLAGLSVTVVVGLFSAIIALAVSHGLDIPLDAALIAFAPGGLETMAAMAVILHADPAYVGTHHILRLVYLSILMPLLLARKRTL
ncbi:AbrB family transcriptional regulator [Allorhizobium pseudoryzae]|uniref:AbrB family transcriptional regulator n=1 Tax=Allorhizobium pseudoryzae TaxID=379684 RepID=UPI003D056505